MSLRHGLLGLLRHRESTGYDLSKMFNESLNYFWKAQMSQVYQELNKLEERGFLTSRSVVQDKSPNKRLYSITEAGIREFQSWLDENDWDNGVATRNIFLLHFFFAADRKTEDVIKILKETRARTRDRLDAMLTAVERGSEYSPKDSPRHRLFWRLTAAFGARSALARLEWMDETIKVLEEGVEHEGPGI